MAMFTSQRVDAPELAAKLALDNPPAYTTFQKVLPFCVVREKAGTLSYMKAVDLTNAGATENRTEADALAEDAVVTGSINYTLALFEKRAYVAEREETNYGDVENVKNAGGTQLAASFFRSLEEKFVTYLTTAASSAVQMTKGGIVSAIQEAVDDVFTYGAPVIVLTRKALRNLRKSEEIRELLLASGKAKGNIAYILGTPNAFRVALADLLEIHEVIVADPALWGASYDTEIFVTATRPEMLGKPLDAIDGVKAAPCAGLIPYVPLVGAAADPYQCARISIWFDNAKKRNEFDADGCLSFVCLDAGAVKRFKLPTE